MRRTALAVVLLAATLSAQTPTTDQINTAIQQIQSGLDALKALMAPPVPPPPPPPPPSTGTVVTVPVGGNLQMAVDQATAGTTILVAATGSYGALTLRNKGALASCITIKSDANVPAPGTRPGPTTVLAKLVSNDGLAPIRAEQKASCYVLDGLAPQPVAGNPGMALVELGTDSATLPTDQPGQITLSHMKLIANPSTGGKRAIAANTRAFTLKDSYVAGFSYVGQDSQAFVAWNGPGPHTLENNYVEASGENILFGGADARSVANTPANCVIRGNYITKPVAWKANTSIQVKNLIELKNVNGCLIENNTVENSWLAAQPGYLLLITPRNDNGTAPFTQVQNVTVQWNVFRHGASFVQISGEDDIYPSARTQNVKLLNNLVYDVDPIKWGVAGNYGPLFQITRGPLNVELGHLSVLYSSPNSNTQAGVSASILLADAVKYKADGLNIHDNVLTEGRYTIFGSAGQGRAAFTNDAPNAILQDNLFIRNAAADMVNYGPDTNYVTAVGEAAINTTTLAPVKSYVTTDGKLIGVDLGQLKARIPSLDLSK